MSYGPGLSRPRRYSRAQTATPHGVPVGGGAWWPVGALVVARPRGPVITDPFGGSVTPAAGVSDNGYPTSLATVQRQPLSSQVEESATLGYAGSYRWSTRLRARSPSLPSVGQVVQQGQVLYQVSGVPVVLLYGSTPAYRTLSKASPPVPDMQELNADLVALGYVPALRAEPFLGRVRVLDQSRGGEPPGPAGCNPERHSHPRSDGLPALGGPDHGRLGDPVLGALGPARGPGPDGHLDYPPAGPSTSTPPNSPRSRLATRWPSPCPTTRPRRGWSPRWARWPPRCPTAASVGSSNSGRPSP